MLHNKQGRSPKLPQLDLTLMKGTCLGHWKESAWVTGRNLPGSLEGILKDTCFFLLREFVLNLEPYVQLEEDFVRNFIKKPRESYEQCFQQSVEEGLRAVQPEGNILVILQEVCVSVCLYVCPIVMQHRAVFDINIHSSQAVLNQYEI